VRTAAAAHTVHGGVRLARLDRAVVLRNGFAHADPSKVARAAASVANERARPTLASYRRHRSAIDRLAVDIDAVVADHLAGLVGARAPW
jgi:DNA integrity scanning protein DisA with diadenylate cyclase activity